ncbi:MAG: hypothetical protein JXB34_12865 [Bacteroidales bacterium]|nr:hypothetical protein [Bacteroidales bacterium]
MKRAILVLAMVLMAATSYNQTSRRTANANGSATRNTETTNENRTRNAPSETRVERNKQEGNSTNREKAAAPDNNKGNVNTAPSNTRPATNTNDRGNSSKYQDNGNRYEPRHDNGNRNEPRHDNGNRYENKPDNRTNYGNHNDRHSNSGYHGNTGDRRSTTTVYVNNSSRKYQQTHRVNHTYRKTPYNRDYRAVHYVYREPVHVNIIWTRDMHRHYIEMYPEVRFWRYNVGYSIDRVSAYYADYYIGEVMNVYGKVSDVFYARETDEYFLYFGAYYPYHDFTIVLPGEIARRYSHRPANFFINQYLNVTGLITVYDGKPEIVVKRNFQLDVY